MYTIFLLSLLNISPCHLPNVGEFFRKSIITSQKDPFRDLTILFSALGVIIESSKINARKLMLTSIIYLPMLLIIIIVEDIIF